MNQDPWTIAGAILLLLFFYVQFSAGRSAPHVVTEAPIVNSATQRGQEPWMANEHGRAEVRKHARKGALEGLEQAWAAHCGEGRRRLISGLDHYFERRGGEQHNPSKAWGESWVRHIKKAWTTADDSRIERLAQEAYVRGYFTVNDFRPGNRAMAAEVLGNEHITGKGCA